MAFFNYPVPSGSAANGSEDARFLEGATSAQWDAIIARVGTEPFVTGQIILEAGDPGDAFFILIDGAVEVLARGVFGERIIARITAGSIFGEISFLDGGLRTATIRAAQAGSLLRVTRDAFTLLQAWEPALAQRMMWDLGRICAQRLRRTVERTRPAR